MHKFWTLQIIGNIACYIKIILTAHYNPKTSRKGLTMHVHVCGQTFHVGYPHSSQPKYMYSLYALL